ncbi:DUF547 domain-containing protein [Halobacterium rubrum]|uniref:DUF547 domain-containing protein n=1 Tax=Halobacterium TaxID=2239 RepID=UPI001F377579|nr:DUF547 domain-containing protein [Halobacterium rubrum]MDH5021322.1 DUF547 domain-containing protein [Halobacterium rubrum]
MSPTEPASSPVACSREYVLATRHGEATEQFRAALAALDGDRLAALDREATTAFWLNTYNAAVQDDLQRDPDIFADKRRLFGEPRLTVAGHDLSLDDVEHGILRGSKSKYGLGYLPRLRADGFQRRHRLPDADPRIHFALNCAAASCPPIAAYTADGVDEELDRSTASFLHSDCEYDDRGRLAVSRLFLYHRGDFGGRSGIYAFLREHGVLDDGERPRVTYQSYDWSRKLGYFTDHEASAAATDAEETEDPEP